MIYYDSELDRHLTLRQIRNEFREAKEAGATTAETLAEYLDNCMSYNGGTLEETDEEYCGTCGALKKISYLCPDCGRI